MAGARFADCTAEVRHTSSRAGVFQTRARAGAASSGSLRAQWAALGRPKKFAADGSACPGTVSSGKPRPAPLFDLFEWRAATAHPDCRVTARPVTDAPSHNAARRYSNSGLALTREPLSRRPLRLYSGARAARRRRLSRRPLRIDQQGDRAAIAGDRSDELRGRTNWGRRSALPDACERFQSLGLPKRAQN